MPDLSGGKRFSFPTLFDFYREVFLIAILLGEGGRGGVGRGEERSSAYDVRMKGDFRGFFFGVFYPSEYRMHPTSLQKN